MTDPFEDAVWNTDPFWGVTDSRERRNLIAAGAGDPFGGFAPTDSRDRRAMIGAGFGLGSTNDSREQRAYRRRPNEEEGGDWGGGGGGAVMAPPRSAFSPPDAPEGYDPTRPAFSSQPGVRPHDTRIPFRPEEDEQQVGARPPSLPDPNDIFEMAQQKSAGQQIEKQFRREIALGGLQQQMRNAPPTGAYYGSESYADPDQWRRENVTEFPSFNEGAVAPRIGEMADGMPFDWRNSQTPAGFFPQEADYGWDESRGQEEFAAAEIPFGPEGDERRAMLDAGANLREYESALMDFADTAPRQLRPQARAEMKVKGAEARMAQDGRGKSSPGLESTKLNVAQNADELAWQKDKFKEQQAAKKATDEAMDRYRNGEATRADNTLLVRAAENAIDSLDVNLASARATLLDTPTHEVKTRDIILEEMKSLQKRRGDWESVYDDIRKGYKGGAPAPAAKGSPQAAAPAETAGQAMARIAREKFGVATPGELTPEQQQEVRSIYAASRK